MKTLLAAALLAASVSVRADDAAPAAASPAAAPAAEAPTPAAAAAKIDKLTLTSGIKERQPIDESATFPSGFPVYAWIQYKVDAPPASIKFVWSADGKKVLEYPVELKSGHGRWWATKKVWPGAWKVEVQSEAGDSLASTDFTVTAKSAEPAPAAKSDAPAEATKSDAPVPASAPAAPGAPNAGGK